MVPLRLLSCLFLLMAPLASAGTAADPEVADPGGDAGQASALDITGAYVDASDPRNVTFHILVPNLTTLPHDTGACGRGMDCVALTPAFQLEFVVVSPDGATPALPGYAGTVVTFRQGAPASLRATIAYRDTNGTLHVEGQARGHAGAGEVVLQVPRSDPAIRVPTGPAPGAFRITQLVASSALEACLPPVPDQPEGVAVLACTALPRPDRASSVPFAPQESRWDVAPDNSHGRDFTFPAPPVAAPPAGGEETELNATETAAPEGPPPAKPPAASTATSAPAPPSAPSAATMSAAPSPASASASTPPAPLTSPAKATPAPGAAVGLGTLALGVLAARRRLSA